MNKQAFFTGLGEIVKTSFQMSSSWNRPKNTMAGPTLGSMPGNRLFSATFNPGEKGNMLNNSSTPFQAGALKNWSTSPNPNFNPTPSKSISPTSEGFGENSLTEFLNRSRSAQPSPAAQAAAKYYADRGEPGREKGLWNPKPITPTSPVEAPTTTPITQNPVTSTQTPNTLPTPNNTIDPGNEMMSGQNSEPVKPETVPSPQITNNLGWSQMGRNLLNQNPVLGRHTGNFNFGGLSNVTDLLRKLTS